MRFRSSPISAKVTIARSAQSCGTSRMLPLRKPPVTTYETRGERSAPRQESRHALHISTVLVAEFPQSLALLDACEPHIHDDKHRKHQQRQQGRPLQQEAEHDDNEAHILRVPDILI